MNPIPAVLFGACLAAASLRAEPSPARTSDQVEFTLGPDYADAPELKVKDGVPKGRVHDFTMKSEDSKIYKGIAKNQKGKVPYERKVAVYVPEQLDKKKPAPFIVVQDGGWYRGDLPKVLDNLIHEKRVPAMVAILVDSGGGDAQGSQRGLEYDTVSDVYAKFVEKEVLPRVEKECDVKLTKDPEARATMGGSSGAAAAFSMAWFCPDLYRRVLSYSGTYCNQQSPVNNRTPHGAWEYHENLIPRAKPKPIRVWLQISEHDNGHDRDDTSFHNWVRANRLMAAALKEKGYAYRYVFCEKAGHVDGRVTRQTLPGALEWLWQGYPDTPAAQKPAP
jgi:enterochelin esterase family protein